MIRHIIMTVNHIPGIDRTHRFHLSDALVSHEPACPDQWTARVVPVSEQDDVDGILTHNHGNSPAQIFIRTAHCPFRLAENRLQLGPGYAKPHITHTLCQGTVTGTAGGSTTTGSVSVMRRTRQPTCGNLGPASGTSRPK